MNPRPPGRGRVIAAAALAFACAPPAAAFLGFADTSFVTVIANPAEAANWAAELESLNSQLAAARGTLATVSELRAFAGDPRLAVGAIGDLGAITSAVGALSTGAGTGADLERAWQELGASGQLQAAARLLQAGPGASMNVFGSALPRDPSLYGELARSNAAAASVRGQITREQAARASVASQLTTAWAQFKAAPDESSKQAVLAEISQLQSEDQVMDARRRALLDDLALADRQDRETAAVRSRASDEQLLAGSALLNDAAEDRARGAQAQRSATLQKQSGAVPVRDYGGIKLWTTADSGGTAP